MNVVVYTDALRTSEEDRKLLASLLESITEAVREGKGTCGADAILRAGAGKSEQHDWEIKYGAWPKQD